MVFAVCVAQNVDTSPGRDPGDNHADDEVRPVGSQPGDEAASHDDSEVRGEIVVTEGVGRADVDVRIFELSEQPDADCVDSRRGPLRS